MGLEGKYSCADLEATLTITEAKMSDGTGTAVFSMNGTTLNVHLNFHFHYDVGPSTNYRLSGSKGGSNAINQYVGMAGYSDDTEARSGIHLAGGLSVGDEVNSFSGVFTKA